MNALDHLTTVQLNGHPVVVHQAHRVGPDTTIVGQASGPTLLTVTAQVALTLDGVAAALFDWLAQGTVREDLADDDCVRELLAESVLNLGCVQLAAARRTAAYAAIVDHEAAGLLAYRRQRAAAVFGPSQAVVGEVTR